MLIPDLVNGLFETFAACSVWANVIRLKRDRDVKGIVWWYNIVFILWGGYNIFYYRHLEQYFSWYAGIILCFGNVVWFILWMKILWERSSQERPKGLRLKVQNLLHYFWV